MGKEFYMGRETIIEEKVRKRTPKSAKLFQRATEIYPDGEISAARMFDPWPFYAAKGEGAYIWDVDGNRYLDCCMCYGVLLLGHRPAPIMKAVSEHAEKHPLHYGAPLPSEVEWGEKFRRCVPCAEKVVLCNTGNEAVHKSINIARTATGRNKIAKFEGGFHGSNEYSLWSVHLHPDYMGPIERPNPIPSAPGMPEAAKDAIVVLPFREEAAFDLIEEHASELAVVMIEPVLGAGGILSPGKEFLQKLREVTERNDVLLLFDEIITGFRLGLGGGQEYFGVTPDIGLFGKALGGGLPIGAIGCKQEIIDIAMDQDPPLLVAGTFSGNATTLAASNAMLDYVMQHSPGIYNDLARRGDHLRSSFNDFTQSKGMSLTMTGEGSMWAIHPAAPPVETPRDMLKHNLEIIPEFELRLRLEGVFLPAQMHGGFLSTAHGDEEVEEMLRAFKAVLEACYAGRKI
jgi:glutamate-1-semialdehyde 2,1-aminomutase